MITSFKYRIILFMVVGLLVPMLLLSQDENQEIIEEGELFRVRLAEFSLEYMLPQNTFKDRMSDAALGASGSFLWQSKPESPAFIGFDVYWGSFYRVSSQFTDVIDGFLSTFDQRTRTSVSGLNMIARYYPFDNLPIIDPFIEGSIGGKLLLTGTSLLLVETGENLEFIAESGKVSFSYGFAAGFQMNVYKYQYYLSFKASYLRGTSNGFYAIPDDLQGASNLTINDLDFRNAPIDLLRLQIGISFAF